MLFPFVQTDRLDSGQDEGAARNDEAAADTRSLTTHRYRDSVQTHREILPLSMQ